MIQKWWLGVALFVGGFAVGVWSVPHLTLVFDNQQETDLISSRLRLNLGSYTNPLLMCDVDTDKTSKRYQELRYELEEVVEKARVGGVEKMAIYFRDFSDGSTIVLHPEERFTPASLNKVPLMITALSYGQKDPAFLESSFVYESDSDANAVQMIRPSSALRAAQHYTVNEAIESMILYSDNGAYDFLTKLISYQDYLNYFRILHIPVEETEGVNVREYAFFLRVLYNSTLLSREMSEKALGLLARSEYMKGLRSGVPQAVPLAHKFGVSGGIDIEGKPVDRQLHDCGIVYVPQKPYLLCVMTKSNAALEEIEQFIGMTSKVVYEYITR